MERHGDSIRLNSFWQVEKIGNRSRAQIMEQGLPALGVAEDTTIIIGGNYSKACFIDLKMPKLAATDLRSALAFELNKHSPIPIDEIQWGYRIVGKVDGSEANLVRLVYFPEDEWESWVAAASGIADGVDMIVPVVAVLDPELRGTDICLGNKNNGSEIYLFKSTDEGERKIICLAPDETMESVFGAGEAPLRKEGLDLGKLGDLPSDQQRNFGPPVLLGMYGLSDAFYQDRKHWLSVPIEMRPRRNRAQKFYTVVVCLYLTILLAIWGGSTLYHRSKELKSLNAESRRLQAEVDKSEQTTAPETAIQDLESEVTELTQSMFSMTKILHEMTTLTNEKLWCTNFNWDSGDIRVELRADTDDPDLTLALQDSVYFTDCSMNKRQLHDGSVNYTITCSAQLPGEKEPETTPLPDEEIDEPFDEDSLDLEEEEEDLLDQLLEGELEDHDELD